VAVTFALFAATAGAKPAFALAMMSGQRNMGLMFAATGGAVPELTWLYFAVSQFPIYLSPLMLGPLARRIERRGGGSEMPPSRL
jgi:BASS family bile acid:Na+ symporter